MDRAGFRGDLLADLLGGWQASVGPVGTIERGGFHGGGLSDFAGRRRSYGTAGSGIGIAMTRGAYLVHVGDRISRGISGRRRGKSRGGGVSGGSQLCDGGLTGEGRGKSHRRYGIY